MEVGEVAGITTDLLPNVTVFWALKEGLTFTEIIDLEVFLEVEVELLVLLLFPLDVVVERPIVELFVVVLLVDCPSEVFVESEVFSPLLVEVDVFVPSVVEVEFTVELFVPFDVELLLIVELLVLLEFPEFDAFVLLNELLFDCEEVFEELLVFVVELLLELEVPL
tara:strand:- start:917 stop:1414 length:498 start_codon:yes stop_codon:yes gene_type:complete